MCCCLTEWQSRRQRQWLGEPASPAAMCWAVCSVRESGEQTTSSTLAGCAMSCTTPPPAVRSNQLRQRTAAPRTHARMLCK